jgi:ABC-type transport system involved in multi-copper enzyme maturation permease subunit
VLGKIGIIATYTFKEILKSKVLLNVFFIGVALMLVTYVATEFTYGVPERVALDFGLGMLSLSSLSISLFLGVSLLSKEIESRTVYMIISRPVPRFAFILGKLLGLMGIQLINILILGSLTLIVTFFLAGQLDTLAFWSLGFTFLESILLLLLVVLVSLFANNILSVLLSIVVLLLGHFIQDTKETTLVKESPILEVILDLYEFILPAFYKLNLKDFVIYNKSLNFSYLMQSMTYGVLYSAFLLLMIVSIFNRKNLD